MSREAHVRFWESAGVRLPGATQLYDVIWITETLSCQRASPIRSSAFAGAMGVPHSGQRSLLARRS